MGPALHVSDGHFCPLQAERSSLTVKNVRHNLNGQEICKKSGSNGQE
jgi:hypothetical protein